MYQVFLPSFWSSGTERRQLALNWPKSAQSKPKLFTAINKECFPWDIFKSHLFLSSPSRLSPVIWTTCILRIRHVFCFAHANGIQSMTWATQGFLLGMPVSLLSSKCICWADFHFKQSNSNWGDSLPVSSDTCLWSHIHGLWASCTDHVGQSLSRSQWHGFWSQTALVFVVKLILNKFFAHQCSHL